MLTKNIFFIYNKYTTKRYQTWVHDPMGFWCYLERELTTLSA